MVLTAWKGGKFENPAISYGIRIGAGNRNQHFRSEWEIITIELDGYEVVQAGLTAGFWKKCPEIRHPAFREFFRKKDVIPWPEGSPPTFELEPIGERCFRLSTIKCQR